jgi:hypothetical protein
MVRSRSQAEVLVAGVKVATQTPPIRSGISATTSTCER